MKNMASVAVALSVILAGCGVQVERSSRSGTLVDDYVEEPLRPSATRYENALKVSNAIVNALTAEDYDLIAREFVDDSMRGSMTAESIRDAWIQNARALGKITGYKSGQWGFVPQSRDGQRYLCSVKIVEHEKGMADYVFVFQDDARYSGVVGFYPKRKTGVRSPERL